jgi:hypothetical protein
MGSFACQLADMLFDDRSVESFSSLIMICSSDEIDRNDSGGLNRRDAGDKVEAKKAALVDSIEIKLEDKRSAKSQRSLSRAADDASISSKKSLSKLLGLRPRSSIKKALKSVVAAATEGSSRKGALTKVGKDTKCNETVATHRIAPQKRSESRRPSKKEMALSAKPQVTESSDEKGSHDREKSVLFYL